MKINEVIRKYRKKENLTQEQIANYLNISAPAVNKWENGVSYPDISLLAPLARILKINIDTLLSFNIELTNKEIVSFLNDIFKTMDEKGFGEGFKKGCDYIKQYPNCDDLIIRICELMKLSLIKYKVEDKTEYEKKIISWFEILASSSNERTASIGKYDLAMHYMQNGQIEKSQKLIDSIPEDKIQIYGSGKKILQAQLFEKQNRLSDAYEIYEQIIFESANQIMMSLSLMINNLCDEDKLDIAEKYSEVAKKTGELYDLGIYESNCNDLMVAAKLQNKEKCIKVLEDIVDKFNNIKSNENLEIYKYKKYKSNSEKSINIYKNYLKNLIKDNEEFYFIKDDPRTYVILEKL